MATTDPQTDFELTLEGAEAINALLPTCKYVTGIRKNETGEVRFCPQYTQWNEKAGIWWWSAGNMGCDCNRELEFRRAGNEDEDADKVKCGKSRYTVLGIWFPNGEAIRDLLLLNDF